MDRLKLAAQVGDINELYNCIKEEEDALGWIDDAELVDTPLHIAANRGHVDFAMAMMSLKPSWGRKLNRDLYSPMHLAVRKGHAEVVISLMAIDKDFVRVKGKEGFTSLHYAVEAGNLHLLVQFLKDCPNCIEDVTIRNETALHIAAMNDRMEALEILARFLERTHLYWNVSKKHLLDSKDRNGNTVLHIAAYNRRNQMTKLLLECKVNTKEINNGSLTAWDVLERQSGKTPNKAGICSTIIREGQTHTSEISDGFSNLPPIYQRLRDKITFYEKLVMLTTGTIENMSADKINALLVVLVLILTATYQALLNPPGDVWKGDESVVDTNSFLYFYRLNFIVFVITSILTVIFLQVASGGSHFIGILFELLLSLLIWSLLVSARVIVKAYGIKFRDLVFLPSPSRHLLFFTAVWLLLMEGGRRGCILVLNPPAIRFYKDFFRQM